MDVMCGYHWLLPAVVQDRVADYVSLLLKDITSQQQHASPAHGVLLQTVYFGGGVSGWQAP
jgi:coproporphyrinogen III oxidase-like Fe-S oxidoreductase